MAHLQITPEDKDVLTAAQIKRQRDRARARRKEVGDGYDRAADILVKTDSSAFTGVIRHLRDEAARWRSGS